MAHVRKKNSTIFFSSTYKIQVSNSGITVYYPEQKAMLQEALDRQILKRANVETEEEMTLFVELTKSGQLGAGECAAIAIASHRTHL